MHPEQILDAVSSVFHVTRDDLVGPKRLRMVSEPRKIAAYLIHKNSLMGYKQIADLLNRNDHTTVMYYVKTVRNNVETQPHFASLVEEVEKSLVSPQAEPEPSPTV